MTDSRSTGRRFKPEEGTATHRVEERVAPYGAPDSTLEAFNASRQASAFTKIWRMRAVERSALVKNGAPSDFVVYLSHEMGMPRERVYKALNLPRSTVERKLQAHTGMSQDESERLIGLSKLIGQVENMVRESGDMRGFSAAKWFAHWMAQPSAALGGRAPEELLDTADGRDAVSQLLAQMQSAAYA
jgi:putative toxin-antitoxin system antitoxin component (TIGR02293 family)